MTLLDLGARAKEWVVKCFGPEGMDRDERAARLLEEAIELAQSEGVPRMLTDLLVERVYSRPPGVATQEAGGVTVCLAAWGESAGWNVEALGGAELRRVESMPMEHFKARHAAKPQTKDYRSKP